MPIRRGKQPPFLCYCRCCWRWFFSALPRFVFAVVFSEPALQPFNIETMLLCIIWLKTSDRFTSSQVIWSFIVVFFPIFSLVYLVDLHFIFIHITHVLNEMFLLLLFFFFYFVPPLLVPHRFLCFWFDYFLHLRITTRHRFSCVHVCCKSE